MAVFVSSCYRAYCAVVSWKSTRKRYSTFQTSWRHDEASYLPLKRQICPRAHSLWRHYDVITCLRLTGYTVHDTAAWMLMDGRVCVLKLGSFMLLVKSSDTVQAIVGSTPVCIDKYPIYHLDNTWHVEMRNRTMCTCWCHVVQLLIRVWIACSCWTGVQLTTTTRTRLLLVASRGQRSGCEGQSTWRTADVEKWHHTIST